MEFANIPLFFCNLQAPQHFMVIRGSCKWQRETGSVHVTTWNWIQVTDTQTHIVVTVNRTVVNCVRCQVKLLNENSVTLHTQTFPPVLLETSYAFVHKWAAQIFAPLLWGSYIATLFIFSLFKVPLSTFRTWTLYPKRVNLRYLQRWGGERICRHLSFGTKCPGCERCSSAWQRFQSMLGNFVFWSHFCHDSHSRFFLSLFMDICHGRLLLQI